MQLEFLDLSSSNDDRKEKEEDVAPLKMNLPVNLNVSSPMLR